MKISPTSKLSKPSLNAHYNSVEQATLHSCSKISKFTKFSHILKKKLPSLTNSRYFPSPSPRSRKLKSNNALISLEIVNASTNFSPKTQLSLTPVSSKSVTPCKRNYPARYQKIIPKEQISSMKDYRMYYKQKTLKSDIELLHSLCPKKVAEMIEKTKNAIQIEYSSQKDSILKKPKSKKSWRWVPPEDKSVKFVE